MSYTWFIVLASTKFLPLALAAFSLLRRWNTVIAALGLILFLGALNDLLSFVAGKNNLWLNYIYNPLEACALALLLYHTLVGNAKKKTLPVVFLLVVGVMLVEGIVSDWTVFNNFSKATVRLMIIVFCFAFFYQHATGKSSHEGWLQLIMTTVLFYYASSFVYFAASRYLLPTVVTNAASILLFMATVHAFINAVCNILYTIGIWKFMRSSSSALQVSVQR